jgi:hypothetical protein
MTQVLMPNLGAKNIDENLIVNIVNLCEAIFNQH